MKKKLVLITLFVVPIVAYLFFATGVHGFTHLPTITPKVADFGNWPSTRADKISLDGKITILGFGGADLLKNRGNLYNLQQKVYLRYHEFNDLQFVYLCPTGTEADAKQILEAMTATTDMSHWHFVFASPDEIKAFHAQLKLQGQLGPDAGTSYVYLIDKDRNLRGRSEQATYKEGYNTFHPSELSNEMLDDFKVMLYEYRAAYKKNNNASQRKI